MITYSNRDRKKKSKVIAYEIGKDFIKVQFTNLMVYTYTVELNGEKVIKLMKYHAVISDGLGSFITRNEAKLKFVE